MRLSLIGSGKLGQQLYRVFSECAEIELVQWMNRSATESSTAEGIPIVKQVEELLEVDCFLLAVNDEVIGMLAAKLPTNSLVIHTSGATEISVFSDHNRRGIFYPIQSFSYERSVAFSELPVGIEASNSKDLKFLEKLALVIQAKPVHLDSTQRKALHLSAVLVNNFSNHLFTKAAKICEENKIPFELLKPLIKETVDKLDDLSPKRAQTGPALREDRKTISAHLSMIEKSELKKLYTLFTSSITNHYKNEKL